MSREICILQQDTPEQGGLQVNVTSTIGIQPIAGAAVKIFSGQTQVEELTTDSSGQTPAIQLPAPPLAYSQEPNQPQPFAEYTIQVSRPTRCGEIIRRRLQRMRSSRWMRAERSS